MAEFWNETLTQASWEKLQELSKKYSFVLIGGWAIYLWSGMQKSKGIDLVVDYPELLKLRSEFSLSKNERLYKYEAKFEKFDIDIYLPGYSHLSVPCEAILKSAKKVQGISVCEPEMLLLLKQGALSDREASVKGRKDLIDIINLLARSGLSLEKYAQYAKKYGNDEYAAELMRQLQSLDKTSLPYIGMNFKEFSDWKKKMLAQLKALA
ncbi:hypothetical protein AUJ17_03065 [Candidatus Micrarchaeota archaeon CG1_02_47_40]|nr:MAG: hypothetical protein AUJ17_03065 [Candidatus Micrarchaeota archaeon CG1_02_47_40]